MATLRELRTKAKELGIAYEKETTTAQLEELIAEKLCEVPETPPVAETPPPPEAAPVRTPARTPVAKPPAPEPAEKAGFVDQVQINEDDLNTEFKNQAAKFAAFAEQEAKAKAKVMVAKLRVEVVSAELTKAIRKRLTDEGVKPTEKMIESEVLLTEQYQTAQQSLIGATCDADMARAAKDAFMQRKDMLIQLGSSRRQEIEQTGMSIRERAKEVMAKSA